MIRSWAVVVMIPAVKVLRSVLARLSSMRSLWRIVAMTRAAPDCHRLALKDLRGKLYAKGTARSFLSGLGEDLRKSTCCHCSLFEHADEFFFVSFSATSRTFLALLVL